MRRGLTTLLIVGLAFGAAGCSSDDAEKPFGTVYSPTGEPLSGGRLGQLKCTDALGRWYERVAQGGALTHDIFMADARRQFGAMDIDHVGLLTPDELARYRAPYEYGEHHARPAADDEHDGAGHRHHHTSEDDDKHRPQFNGADDRADPVMSADRHNRNEVSLDDFLVYEDQNFRALDTNHDGQITKPELLAQCPS